MLLSAASAPEAGLGHACLPGVAGAQSPSGIARGGLGRGGSTKSHGQNRPRGGLGFRGG